MDNVLVSIIIPSLNQGDLIENAILSVLKQKYQNWELLIQDGNSHDSTESIVSRYAVADARISFKKETDGGFADAVNKAMARCRGTLIGIQSSDDFYASGNVFSEAVAIYRQYPSAVMISGHSVLVDTGFRQVMAPFTPQENGFIRPESIFTLKNHFAQGATFFSRDRAQHVNGLRAEVDMVADTDLWVRLSNYHPVSTNSVFRTSQVWSCVTIHQNQRSTNYHRFYLGRARMAVAHYNDDNIRLDRNYKFKNAINLINIAYEYYCSIGEDASAIRTLYKDLTGETMAAAISWEKLKDKIPFLRRLKEENLDHNSSMNKLVTYCSGYPLKWF